MHYELRGIQTVAYLFSFLESSPEKITELRSIAFHLHQLSLGSLFKIYNTTLVRNGNHYATHGGSNFLGDISELIQTREANLSCVELLNLVKEDKECARGALFLLL